MHVDDRKINHEMVAEGNAWWYRKYAPKSTDLKEAETEARKEKRGLSLDKIRSAPWEYRRHAIVILPLDALGQP